MGQYERHVFVCTAGDNSPGHGPMIVVYPENVWYAGVQESDLPEILESHILNGVPVKRLIYDPGVKGANKVK